VVGLPLAVGEVGHAQAQAMLQGEDSQARVQAGAALELADEGDPALGLGPADVGGVAGEGKVLG